MQYLRERLSLNLPQGQTLDANAAYGTHGSTSNTPPQNTLPKPPDGEIRDGKKSSEVTVSPTTSAFSGASFHSTQPKTLGTPPSAYSTPFQSPVASEKWNPHSQRVLPQQTTSTVVQVDKTTPSPTGVFVIDRGQFSSYPHSFATPVTGGYVNHSFANDSGNNGRPNQPQWNSIAWCSKLQSRGVSNITNRPSPQQLKLHKCKQVYLTKNIRKVNKQGWELSFIRMILSESVHCFDSSQSFIHDPTKTLQKNTSERR
ncbi:uncharacterized protein LOC131679787 isoform X1 [Topomyia yanbarensis]|uniref:uncharacterized protein LOC131679787 isoform X1 n=1 Tax=Topomyia yanbarensis TaxID=2498891 RepID=UPI00273ABAFC|nr:uncharacterized protein LOC131679787 isoform X1 [Topomyia yanbarensis]XP_058816514.1 uncharacterized protein LOC131679787 isoform X1 [Topomyia yanbarensis]XP_058816515.1 uncharacterized protein LOC131679787 isoform X1 [Topomyia yanbarensis]XP_058816516.1 uncharacterized protein LOC131679787 isoform X1 [Topomyia yanbarensis]XP_058816517.1 uncharacterized protein LOC131679787 isoform X1 [Topomyia yanbarensis]